MNPVLYEQTETEFSTQGIGVLVDALKCIVSEELNNVYDLEMEYPVTGAHFSDLTLRRIVKAKPNQTDDPQPFRIYRITKPLAGIVTVYAHHLSYDLSGMVVPPFEAETPSGAVASITGTAVPTINPFSFTVSSIASKAIKIAHPTSARSILGEMITAYDLDISYDMTVVSLMDNRGADNGAVIAYGKNLIDLTQEENCSEVCTGVYPFFHTEEDHVELTEKIISIQNAPEFTRIMPLDLTSEFQSGTVPTEAELRVKANQYIANNDLGVPKVNLTVKYVSLLESKEAIPLDVYDCIALGDVITIRFEKLGIDKQSRCIRYEFDSLKEHVESITIGDVTTTFADTMAKTMFREEEYASALKGAVARATSMITNGAGGYVMLHKSNPALTQPDELLILGDSPDLSQAQQVWRWNKYGLAYSNHGYNPYPYTYKTAMTEDGEIVADMITTGILSAIEIYNHSDSEQATFHVSSAGQVTATKGTIGGLTIGANSLYNSTVELHNTSGLRVLDGNGHVIGRIAAIGTNSNTVAFLLSSAGETISWAVEDQNGQYQTIISYVKSTNTLTLHAPLDMHGYPIYNMAVDRSGTLTAIKHSYLRIDDHQTYYTMYIEDWRTRFNSMGQFTGTELISRNEYNIRKA